MRCVSVVPNRVDNKGLDKNVDTARFSSGRKCYRFILSVDVALQFVDPLLIIHRTLLTDEGPALRRSLDGRV